ncbi:MAG: hypothetical protein D3917_08830 [Candidatus Electrothrix sp. AX5]|jgi:hypothetical protein|nr:hypothetical protein [Candidatus Electrothrix sp. AX5]
MIIDYTYIFTRILLKYTRIIATWLLESVFFAAKKLKKQHIFVGTEKIWTYDMFVSLRCLPSLSLAAVFLIIPSYHRT